MLHRFSEFSLEDLECIKIFLIFIKKMDSGMFSSGGSPYSPYNFLLRVTN